MEEEAKKDKNDLRKISLEDQKSRIPSLESRTSLKKASVIEINLNDLDIHQIASQSTN